MAKTPMLFSLCCLTNLILVLKNALANSNSLTLRLIHPHSQESPYFRSNLSSEERIKSSVLQSNICANYQAKTQSSGLRMQIDVQVYHYVVKIGIGKFKSKPPYKEYYLEMDTGSGLIWIQCEGCTKCFNQTPKPFPKQNSSSFHPVLIDNKPSYYECEYEDGDSTRGMLAGETFYLRSNNGKLAKMENLKFGCGLHNDMQYANYRNNKIAGIMGLGSEDLSFVNQLGPLTKGRFSYCLPFLSSKTSNTYLRFGDDKFQPRNARSTPLYTKNETSPYYLELQGIRASPMLTQNSAVRQIENDVGLQWKPHFLR